MRKPSVFVASSTKHVDIARALQTNLNDIATVIPWDQGIFELSKVTIESLIEALSSFDFAIFVFGPDDVTRINGKVTDTVRDNVVFEAGLFIGRLGRDRCFFVKPKDKPIHILSDLLGVTFAEYEPTLLNENSEAALGIASNKIRQSIKKKAVHNLLDSVAGEWLEIKDDRDTERPFAFVTFEADSAGEVKVYGRSYSRNGDPGIRFGRGEIDVAVVRGNSIIHAYDTHWKGEQAYGISQFFFDDETRLQGRGFYVSYGTTGQKLKSQHTEFRIKKLTPEIIQYYIDRDKIRNEDDRRAIAVSAAKLLLKRIVITGGPFSGKTALLQYMSAQPFQLRYLPEAALAEITELNAFHRSVEKTAIWRKENALEFQLNVFRRQLESERNWRGKDEVLFLDRSGIDCIAYLELANVGVPSEIETYARESFFTKVFALDVLVEKFDPRLETGRTSSSADAVVLGRKLIEVYRRYGYEVVRVPVLSSIEDRAEFILRQIEEDRIWSRSSAEEPSDKS